MSDSVSDSANERSSQYDAPLPEKRITFDSRAQENNAGPSKIPVARAMRIPCVTQSSGDSNQNDGNTQEIGDIVIEAHGQHNSENRNERTIIPVRTAGGKEGRRERQRKYREKHREIIRERNRNYYSQRHRNAQPTASGSGLNDIEAVPDDVVVNNQEDNRKRLRDERSRRYRENNREAIKQRNKDFRQRQKKAQQQSEVPNTDTNEVLESSTYSNFIRDKLAHKSFTDNFKNNQFGHACSVCDRLWFQKDLKNASSSHEHIIHKITVNTHPILYLSKIIT